ncbi:hypothetical protein BDV40DRAFT_299601 [Aspergillus tamarii]|uniref:Uncharacterized protein n=1 Tax=Aspergillus tamarii TaxID=41984 RepID=A0A5N6UX88_ASPTM|nr:hypothetical protein BDV40DRAFT_299601 [Aspergillus tamarii]
MTLFDLKAAQSRLISGAGPISLAISIFLRMIGVSNGKPIRVVSTYSLIQLAFSRRWVFTFSSAKPGGAIFNGTIYKKPLSLNQNNLGIKEKKAREHLPL